jgi:hypothetical protein
VPVEERFTKCKPFAGYSAGTEVVMAICSVLLGGLVGFFTFLSAYFVFDTSFLMAMALYAGIGSLLSISLMALLLSCREVMKFSNKFTGAQVAVQARSVTARLHN